ncbi:hypothetical protein RRG08_039743 [Elysia crispata]|uniref:Uncharacterized protein n=1 Tax=Elysia crispata TaxID=231223 RepID=A0AAE0YBQ1_9GAST|nr:hypothetical protein RRG08_039743 [Elysia crispata]
MSISGFKRECEYIGVGAWLWEYQSPGMSVSISESRYKCEYIGVKSSGMSVNISESRHECGYNRDPA